MKESSTAPPPVQSRIRWAIGESIESQQMQTVSCVFAYIFGFMYLQQNIDVSCNMCVQ